MNRAERILGVVFVSLLAIAAASAGAPRLSIDAQYDPDDRTLDGSVEVTLEAPGGTAYFLLLPNLAQEQNPYLSQRAIDEIYPRGFEPARLIVLSVDLVQTEGTTSLPFRTLALPPAWQTYSLDEAALAVDLPAGAGPATLRIEFLVDVPRTSRGDEGITDDVLTWRFGWYPLPIDDPTAYVERDGLLVRGDGSAFPFVLPPAESEVALTVPVGLRVYSGADGVESEALDAAWTRYRLRYDGVRRAVAFTVGANYRTYTLDGPIPIDVVHFAGHDEEARLFATYARDILDDYESRYGPYPHARLTIVESTNRDGTSFAADGIVWLSRRYFTHRDVLLPGILNRLAEFVLAHEIAHQWFGTGTGIDLNRDGWLSEGLAHYLAVGYFEAAHGPFGPNLFDVAGKGLLEEFVVRQFGFYNLREHLIELSYILAAGNAFDEALVTAAEDARYANASSVRLYDKGYLVARAIASAIGEERFEDGLRTAIERTREGILNSRGLQAILEEASGEPLGALFDAWVFGPGSVDYSIEIVARRRIEGGHRTSVVVRRDGGAPQPVTVEATLSSGATVAQEWDGADAEATLVFVTPSSVARVTIDPEHRLPDRDRLNNHAPVKIVAAATKAALPLDAYVLWPDATGQTITLSHLDRLKITIGENRASAAMKLGRGEFVQLAAELQPAGLAAGIAYSEVRYRPIETGSPGEYWAPEMSFAISARRLFDGARPFLTLRAEFVDLASLSDPAIRAVAFDVAEPNAVRISAVVLDEARIWPSAYLMGRVELGLSFGDLPRPLHFGFPELHGGPTASMPNKLSGALAVELPSTSDLPYNVLNLALIDRVLTRVYIAGGTGWTTLDQFGTTTPYAEAGGEQIFEMSTLGGLIPLAVQLGVAVPLTGNYPAVIYVQISF